jgi:hypothetical protein
MVILEIDAYNFKIIDGDKIIIDSKYNRMNKFEGIYSFYNDDYLYEIPANKVILKRKLV